jgi:pimeloyl-ACP methyl ester carboxylesterase
VKVLLLHGFPLDERQWEPQHDALTGFKVVAPNLYDLGGRSVEGWAEALLERVDGDLVPVGASMGGYVALALARRAPDRVLGLVLVGSRAAPDSADRRAFREETIRAIRERGVEGWNPEVAGERTAEELVRATEALRDRPDATDVVASFAGPLLLVVGADDEVLSVLDARAVAESAPDGRLEVVPDAGHFVNNDQPEGFNALLSDFLARWR